jgi:hypothetical protein
MRSAWLLLVVLGVLGTSAPSRGQAPPVQEAPFQACPCWLGPEELVGEMRAIHSDISFTCYLTDTRSAIEIYARSSGVGGPFRLYVYATQPRGALDSSCSHFHHPHQARGAPDRLPVGVSIFPGVQ